MISARDARKKTEETIRREMTLSEEEIEQLILRATQNGKSAVRTNSI